ncbi:TPA: hypothetical protein MX214_004489 [Citrobacter sedlakii]|nr:hypothetical protein [Citrobacter sedlakii]HCA7137715.1 hypothetical protein [Citrobacter sedlakii]HCA7183849.1 hypothetical protein [Citrobacter sedlakii]
MRKCDFLRIGGAFIITAALIAFINLASDIDVNSPLSGVYFALPITFGLLGFIMTIYGFFSEKI